MSQECEIYYDNIRETTPWRCAMCGNIVPNAYYGVIIYYT